jgi:hypothetical protein
MRAHVAPRRNYSSVDVDAAKHAALSALAGLDMTTTRANLDASKAAAATARANGEIPTHVRKSNLRSVSCRQLGTGSSAVPGTGGVPATALLPISTGASLVPGGVGKTVAFDDAASKVRPADGSTVKSVQWRTGTTTLDASGQPRRPTRAPASRCISLPHVLQGRAGMASRLAASYAADPGLAQQFQLLDGGASNHTHPLVAPGLAHMTAGAMPQMDVLSMYQLQQAAAASGNNQLLGQRPFGTNTSMLTSTMDDSMLGQVRSGGLMMPGQHMHAQLQQQVQVQQLQQQQQQQQAALAGNWSAAHQQQVAWVPGAGQVPVAAGAALTNQQLLVQLQQQGAAVAGIGAGNEGLWLQAPAMSAAMQMPAGGAGRSTGLMLSGGAGGQQGMASPHLQQAFGGATLGGASSSGGGTFQALLDQYQQVSWALLVAAQTEGTIREQLLTEVVLQLTMLHTLSGVLQSSLKPSDAITDFEYLGSAARRHMATFNRLSQAGDIAVQQLAMIAPLACRHLGSPGVRGLARLWRHAGALV